MKFRILEGYDLYLSVKQIYNDVCKKATSNPDIFTTYRDTYPSGKSQRMKFRFLFDTTSARDEVFDFAEQQLNRKCIESVKDLFKLSKGTSYRGFPYFTLSSPAYSVFKSYPEEGEMSPEAKSAKDKDDKAKAKQDRMLTAKNHSHSLLSYLVQDMKEQLDCLDDYQLVLSDYVNETGNFKLTLKRMARGFSGERASTEEEVRDISAEMDDYLRSYSQYWLNCEHFDVNPFDVFVVYTIEPDIHTAYKNYTDSGSSDDGLMLN